jgi:hypothetical protein
VDALDNALNIIENLQYTYDYESIIELINSLPAVVTIDNLEVIETIESKYEKLTPAQKALVVNYNKFEIAREQMNDILDNLGVDIDSYIPDLVTETLYLPQNIGNQKLSWSVSNSELININNEYAYINQLHQTHQNHEVTFTVVVTIYVLL